jgi:hypothetical protein
MCTVQVKRRLQEVILERKRKEAAASMGNLKLGNIICLPKRIHVNESMIIEPLVRLRGQKQFVCSVQVDKEAQVKV